MDKRTRRVFTPEQKFAMLQESETYGEGAVGERAALSFGVSEVEAAISGGRSGLATEQSAAEAPGPPALGGREQKAQGVGAQSVLDHL